MEKKITYIELLNTLKSKNLIILYIQDFVEKWDRDFYYQCQGMWVSQKRRYKKFSTYLFYQLLNSKRSVVLTQKFNRFSFGWMDSKSKWKTETFLDFCKDKKVFANILKKDQKNIRIVQLLIGFNLIIFNLIPFSITKMRILITHKKKYVKELLHYISLFPRDRPTHPLYYDIKKIKLRKVSEAHKKQISINKKLVILQLKACELAKLLPQNLLEEK